MRKRKSRVTAPCSTAKSLSEKCCGIINICMRTCVYHLVLAFNVSSLMHKENNYGCKESHRE